MPFPLTKFGEYVLVRSLICFNQDSFSPLKSVTGIVNNVQLEC
jgi:hypothetical protein